MEEDFDKIIVGFYSAAAGALGWRRALLPMKEYFQAWAVQVVGLEVDKAAVTFSYEVGDAPAECTVDYVRTYHRHDPRARMVMALPPLEWLSCHEHFDEEFVARNRFYQEFLLPYGGRYTSGTKLLHDGSETVLLGIMRGRDSRPLGVEELAAARRLARHLGEALKLDRAHRARAPQMSLGMALLSRIGAPMLLLDEQRGLRYANPAAVEWLALEDGLFVRASGLACVSAADQSALICGCAWFRSMTSLPVTTPSRCWPTWMKVMKRMMTPLLRFNKLQDSKTMVFCACFRHALGGSEMPHWSTRPLGQVQSAGWPAW